jgi:hypothetical protein
MELRTNPSIFLGTVVSKYPSVISIATSPEEPTENDFEKLMPALNEWSLAPSVLSPTMRETTLAEVGGLYIADAGDAYWISRAFTRIFRTLMGKEEEDCDQRVHDMANNMELLIRLLDSSPLSPFRGEEVGAWRQVAKWIYSAKQTIVAMKADMEWIETKGMPQMCDTLGQVVAALGQLAESDKQ